MRATSAYLRARHTAGIIAVRESIEAMPAAAVPHPLGPPTLSSTNVTVDLALNQSTRITNMIMDLSLQRFIADRVFANAGGVTNGSVIYDELVMNELYTDRDVQIVQPGGEFPVITSSRQAPKIASVQKWGGKVWISDEARDRNNASAFVNQIRQLTNTIVRKINQKAISVLEASIALSGQTAVGRSWGTYAGLTPNTTAFNAGPLRDIALAQQLADTTELGVRYNLWLVNPIEMANLIVGAGGPANFGAIASAMNVEFYASNRVTAGTAYALERGAVGEMRVEKPLGTETWREEKRERTWVQASVRPVMYVTNPYSVIKFTGLT